MWWLVGCLKSSQVIALGILGVCVWCIGFVNALYIKMWNNSFIKIKKYAFSDSFGNRYLEKKECQPKLLIVTFLVWRSVQLVSTYSAEFIQCTIKGVVIGVLKKLIKLLIVAVLSWCYVHNLLKSPALKGVVIGDLNFWACRFRVVVLNRLDSKTHYKKVYQLGTINFVLSYLGDNWAHCLWTDKLVLHSKM